MAAMALTDGSRLPVALGRDYALHSPPASDGIFHPKIILQLGRETGRAFVSSANATGAGLGGNVEIAIEIDSGHEEERKSAVEGKSVSVRVDSGGRRSSIKKK